MRTTQDQRPSFWLPLFVGLAGLVLSACGSSSNSMDVGDCFFRQPGGSLITYDKVDCEDQHHREVLGVVPVGETDLTADGSYPADAQEIHEFAAEACEAMFAPYTGFEIKELTDDEFTFLRDDPTFSRLDDFPNYGTTTFLQGKAEWESGNRGVICMAEHKGGRGSLQAGAETPFCWTSSFDAKCDPIKATTYPTES